MPDEARDPISEHHGHQDPPATHGMLLVGERRAYLSHLPMFHSPHDFQVILEVVLERDGTDVLAEYVADRRASGEPVYTWVPQAFSLSNFVASPVPGFTMTGDVFRGHFERGGVPILNGVRARVTRTIFADRLPVRGAGPTLDYLLFGAPNEAFVAHQIKAPPDFDQVAMVTPTGAWSGEASLFTVPDRPNTVDGRLRPEEIVTVRLQSGDGDALGLTIGLELYFESGELAG